MHVVYAVVELPRPSVLPSDNRVLVGSEMDMQKREEYWELTRSFDDWQNGVPDEFDAEKVDWGWKTPLCMMMNTLG